MPLYAPAACQNKLSTAGRRVSVGQGHPEVLTEGYGTMLHAKLQAQQGIWKSQLPTGPPLLHCRAHRLLG